MPAQRLELIYWMNVFRYGEEAANRPIDRTVFESMTMEEFDRRNEEAYQKDEQWREANGLPPRAPSRKA